MAQYPFTLQSIDSTYTDPNNPNTNYNSATVMSVKEGRAYVKFADFPVSYKKKKILDLSLSAYCYNYGKYDISTPDEAGAFSIAIPSSNLDFSELTYNKFHGGGTLVGTLNSKNSVSWVNVSLNFDTYAIKELIQKGVYAEPLHEGQCTFYLQKSNYAPYIQVVTEDYSPTTQNHSPASGFINEKAPNTFRWDIVQTNSVEPIGQSSAVFRWKQTGQSTIHTINVSGSKTEVTVPANTFTGDSIQWQIQVTSDDGVLGVASDWFTLSTVDGTPTATPVSPIDAYVDASADNVFQYRYSISTNTSPTRYEMQYSANNGDSWVDFSNGDTSSTSATIPANTFPAGTLLWRVRAYNTDGVVSAWSSPVQIVSRAAPPQPSLNIMESTPRPLFQWQSDGQVSYRFWVQSGENILFDTKETPGTDKTIRLNEYLSQGAYTAYLWVKNSFGLKSSEAAVSFGVDFVSPNAPTLSIEAGEDKAILSINGSGYSQYYIFRDEIMIGKQEAPGKWEDYTACGEHIYWVRGVTKSDAFADSEQVSAYIPVNYAVISDPKQPDQKAVLKLRRGEYPVVSGSVSPQAEGFFYAGRSRPVYQIGEFIEEPVSMSFSLKTKTEFDSLSSIVKKGKTLLYRDYRGERFYLVLTSVDYERDPICYDFSLSGQKVDYVEAIEYDPLEVVSE